MVIMVHSTRNKRRDFKSQYTRRYHTALEMRYPSARADITPRTIYTHMKKTLITLAALAMASVAQAATVTDTYTLNDFENGILTLNNSLSFDSDWSISFSAVVDYGYADGVWGTTILGSSGNSESAGGFRIWHDSEYSSNSGQIVLTANGNGNSKKDVLVDGGTYTFQIDYFTSKLWDDGWTYNRIMRMTVYDTDDNQVGYTSSWNIADPTADITALTSNMASVGWTLAGDNKITVTTAAPVPEPATATLSLLALAGLAARRRRK